MNTTQPTSTNDERNDILIALSQDPELFPVDGLDENSSNPSSKNSSKIVSKKPKEALWGLFGKTIGF